MIVKNVFDKGPEGWCSYDYHGSLIAGRNIFVQTTREGEGGVNGAGYVWCNEASWSADTPERPLSILPLVYYPSWVGDGPVDLRDSAVSVYLRGDSSLRSDGFQLEGAECYFWIVGGESMFGTTRWHYSSRPIPIEMGGWASSPTYFPLANDEALWHMSWSVDPERSTPLDAVLAKCISYGFSFVGFSQEVRGKLSMGGFAIGPT